MKQRRWRYALIPLFMLGQFWALWRLMRAEKFDLIHAHWLIPQGVVAVCLSLFTRLPALICTSHGGDLFALRGGLLTRLKKLILKKSQALTVVSHAMERVVLEWGIAAEKVRVISMGVDLQHAFIPAAGGRTGKKLLFVGRLVEKKGVDCLLAALPAVLRVAPDVQLQIVGTGNEEHSLKAQVVNLGLSGAVTFSGAVNNAALPALYQAADIVVFPSRVARDGDREGFGLVLVEALGCGCAVVATDLPAMQDIVTHEENALIVPQADVAALAAAIIRLLADAELRAVLGQRGREFVLARYDWDKITADYWALMTQVIKEIQTKT